MGQGRPTPPRAVQRFVRPRISIAQLPPDKRDQALERILQQLDIDIVALQESREAILASIADLVVVDDGLDTRLTVLETAIRPIADGRVSTDGAGGFSSNVATGCTVTISGQALRFTFDEPRETPLRYHLSGVYASSSVRVPLFTAYTADYCEITTRDHNNTLIDVSAASVTLTFTIEDRTTS